MTSSKNKGVALVTALLVVSLAATAAVTLSAHQQFDIRRTANLINGDQAWLYAKGAEAWSMVILMRDLVDNTTDSLQDTWAQTLPPIELPGGFMTGEIEDLHGRLNLNNLVQVGNYDRLTLNRFQRLLEVLELEPKLAQAVVDWLDGNIDALTPDGAEDDYYLGLEYPYLAANRKLVSVSELRLIKGFDQNTYERLKPYVAALPERTKINVNTAPAVVLACLEKDIDLELATEIIEKRKEEPFEKVEDFTKLVEKTTVNIKDLSVTSQYFMLHNNTQIGKARARLDSLIYRGGKTVPIRVLQRSERL
jgi:general secretion pathway protein K